MAEFKWYRNVNTGKLDYLPEHVGDLFYDSLVEVDPNETNCVDCSTVEDESENELLTLLENPDFEAPDPVIETRDKSKDK